MQRDIANSIHQREELIRLLSESPADVKSRIKLAKLFFEDGLYPFYLRELKEVATDNEEVQSLVLKIRRFLGDYSVGSQKAEKKDDISSKKIAEIEI